MTATTKSARERACSFLSSVIGRMKSRFVLGPLCDENIEHLESIILEAESRARAEGFEQGRQAAIEIAARNGAHATHNDLLRLGIAIEKAAQSKPKETL